ncbi:MAG: rhomboid family intramembrane serine protease [bacterium]|nr:rhomboid family intramembrane serine protease [bacterium]
MRRRTPLLLATPAVVAAMAVAVPALAGSSSGGGAHKSPAPTAHVTTAPNAHTSSRCIIALVGKRRVRECLVTGPRGPRGVRGFLGPNGPRGVQGKTGRQGPTGEAGATGSQGLPGTARAYALVQPEAVGLSPSEAGLVQHGQTVGIIVINLVFGFAAVGISNAAHLGGLVAGFLFSLPLVPPAPRVPADRAAPPQDLSYYEGQTIEGQAVEHQDGEG